MGNKFLIFKFFFLFYFFYPFTYFKLFCPSLQNLQSNSGRRNVQLAHHNQSMRCWICAPGLVHRTCVRSAESCCSHQSGIPSHDHWLQVHRSGLGLRGNQHRSGEAARQSAAAPDATVQPPTGEENTDEQDRSVKPKSLRHTIQR